LFSRKLAAVQLFSRISINFFLPPQIPKRPDIRDDKRRPKLIFRAHLAQRDAAVFQR
jgi:hypothetical protein